VPRSSFAIAAHIAMAREQHEHAASDASATSDHEAREALKWCGAFTFGAGMSVGIASNACSRYLNGDGKMPVRGRGSDRLDQAAA